MVKALKNRPRNEKGKFIEFSPLGDRTIGLRLYKEDQEIFWRTAKELGLTPTELARHAIQEWLETKQYK